VANCSGLLLSDGGSGSSGNLSEKIGVKRLTRILKQDFRTGSSSEVGEALGDLVRSSGLCRLADPPTCFEILLRFRAPRRCILVPIVSSSSEWSSSGPGTVGGCTKMSESRNTGQQRTHYLRHKVVLRAFIFTGMGKWRLNGCDILLHLYLGYLAVIQFPSFCLACG
jgi:hypothetical protein